MCHLHPPGVPDGAEDGLLDVPPHAPDVHVVLPPELVGSGRGDAPVHDDQLEPFAGALVEQVAEHKVAGVLSVSVRSGEPPLAGLPPVPTRPHP